MNDTAEYAAGAPVTRRLTRADIPAIHALYLEALQALPNPGAVRPDEPSFFDWAFDVGGDILGMTEDGSLVAYGVVRPELASERDRVGLRRLVGPGEGLRVLDGSAVRPEYWGRGWQRRMILARVEFAAARGAEHVIAKASPANLPSLRNLLRCGFATVALVRKPYGWRYVQHRSVLGATPAPLEGVWVEARRIEEALCRFEAGEAGFACDADPQGRPQIRFADASTNR